MNRNDYSDHCAGDTTRHTTAIMMTTKTDQYPKIISVLGASAGLDDELVTWLEEQAQEVDAPVPIIAVAVLRDYMRACKALRSDIENTPTSRKLN